MDNPGGLKGKGKGGGGGGGQGSNLVILCEY